MQQRPPPTLAAPRTREVGSGYKSPTPSTPNSRRYPSPILSRTLPASSQVGPKRAQSAERRRPSTPRSPWSPSSTPVRDSSIDMHLSSRRLSTGSGSPDGLWPSAMRSLSVSFQSDSISFPVSKKEKPPPVSNVSFDRTMRTSSNVAQRQAETPSRSRKSTPERKRSPLKGKNVQDHSENGKPADSLHSRLIDQHRWPSRIGGKVSSNSLNKSLDLTDKAGKASATPVGIGLSSLRRNPISDSGSKPLQKSCSDAAKLSFEEFGKTGPKAHTVDDTISLVSELQKLSTRLSDRMSLITPAARSHPSPPSGSCPSSPSRNSVSRGLSPIRTRPSRGVSPVPTRPSTPSSRGVSPTLTRPSTLPSRGISPVPTRPSTPPSRGVSPSRVRASSGSTQSSSSSVLGFIVDVRKGKMGASYIEEAHYLRLLYNRYLQWRFANDRAEAILFIQAVTAENTLYNVWKATLALWDSVMRKSINLQQLNLELRLNAILNDQMACLDDWALLEEDHLDSLSGAVEDLQASTLHLPVTGGAKTDIESLRVAICSAVDVMQAMGSSICSLLSRVEDKNGLVSELATMVAQERTMLDECEALLASTAAMQMEEYSKNAHLIQVKQAIEKQCPWNLPPWP